MPEKAARPMAEALEMRSLLSASWFVSPAGADINPGTLAAPFKTIQRAANAAGAGDTVYIRAGVYHETVRVPHSGTSAAPITFRPYNSEPVTIDGADPISGWTNKSGSIWTTKMGWDLGRGNNEIFVDGKMVNEARWPNMGLDISRPNLSMIQSIVSATATTVTFHDSALTQPLGFWVGATIQIGSGEEWVRQTGTVTASKPGYLTFSYVAGSLQYEIPRAPNKYALMGIAGALDSAGEWFRAPDGTLSLWTSKGDSPEGHLVEAKARQFGFDLSLAAHIKITGIKLVACTINTSKTSIGTAIDHITATYLSQFTLAPSGWIQPSTSGIVLKGAGSSLTNSVIAFSPGDGVYVTGAGSVVSNNVIHDIDYQGGDSAAVHIGGTGVHVVHNTIYNCARDGVLVYGPSELISYNLIHDFGLQDTDLGGIYNIGGNGHGTEASYNIIYNGVTGFFGGVGIFFDNNTSGFLVHHNITWNVNVGISVNDSGLDNQIYNNTLDATRISIVAKGGDWTGSIVENNLIPRTALMGTDAILKANIVDASHFQDIANHNYGLAAGSKAINTGVLIPPFTNGYVGSKPDVGALELGLTPFVAGADVSLLPPVL